MLKIVLIVTILATALASDFEYEHVAPIIPVAGVGLSKSLNIGIRFNKPLITFEPHYEPVHHFVSVPHHVHRVALVPEHRIAPLRFHKSFHFGIGL
ncbi:hypothetical protein FQR65_LT03169 [Abscondita terminalis]|nr:hypothetical protein FQR65_LT03169 [Abscondita terminalis]